MAEQHLTQAKELAREIESIDGIKSCTVDDWTMSKTRFSMFATPEDDANLHSVSQLVRSTVHSSEFGFVGEFLTPSKTRRGWYDFDITIL